MSEKPLLCKMEFIKDKSGQEMLIKDDQHQVMMEWEKPYMEACIEALCPTGHVLEIGYGCGYSAAAIQKFNPKSHTIIEYHPVVAQRAREWASSFKNVHIVEDTWQHALDGLGVFDQIFFDDYPLESSSQTRQLVSSSEKASWIVDKGKKILQAIKDKFSFIESIQYQDEDLEYFFSEILKKKSYSQDHFLPFFYGLHQKGQITPSQYDNVLKKMIEAKIITCEMLEVFKAKMEEKSSQLFSFAKRGDRFFEFLQQCLQKHMQKNSRFSCYIEHPVSRYEDEEFTKHIILNPNLQYEEKWVDVQVPEHCAYYKGSEALVMVITMLKD
jgi:hypothetical protein